MGEFIKVEVAFSECTGLKECGGCVRVCPVNIFDNQGDKPVILQENEDECTLCDLCIQACEPGAISILRLYEE